VASILPQIRKEVYRGLKGKLDVGTLRRVTGGTVNSKGDLVGGTPTTYSFEGIREDFSAFYRVQAGVPDTDSRFLILAASITVEPKKDDLILHKEQWYKVRRMITIDPAFASYSVQVYKVSAP
jgi:hypothetical protein